MTKVHMRDLRELGWCSSGARKLFKKKGWDWNKFLSEGKDLEECDALDPYFKEKLEEKLNVRRK